MNGTFTFTFDKGVKMCRVESDSPELYGQLLEVYTVANPSFFYEQTNGIPDAEEFLSTITPTGTFRIGMFIPIYKTALDLVGGDKDRISIDDESKRNIADACNPLNGIFGADYEIGTLDSSRPLRYYQIDAIKKLLKYGKGICVSPTGSGKSLIIATLINELFKNSDRIVDFERKPRILLAVPTRQLVDQMYTDFMEYGLTDVCKWTSNSGKKRMGTFEDNSCSDGFKSVIISNHKWICDHLKGGGTKSAFPIKEIGCIIADEVHTVKRKTRILKVVERINPRLRFGFTGTLPGFIFDKWSVIGSFGIPVYMAEVKKFQDEGFLSKIEIQPVYGLVKDLEHHNELLYSINHKYKLNDKLPDGTVVDTSLPFKMENEFYDVNASELYGPMFGRISEMFDMKSRNMIVLFDRLTIGKSIYDTLKGMFEGDGINVHYIDGSIDVSIREKVRSELENTNGNILVAQAVTASVGLNIRNLNGIAFAFAGKSFVRVVQSIGRVIRLKDDGSTSQLFELYFNTRYSNFHHKEKMDILKRIYGTDCIKRDVVVRI